MARLRHAGNVSGADANEVTALAASRFGLPVAVAPAKAPASMPRSSMWSEPEPWIVAVLLATGVCVIARHPIARAIGTEVGEPTMTPSVVATAPPAATTATAPALAAAEPVATHSPRDPFRALLAAGGAIAAPQAGTAVATTTVTSPSTPQPVTPSTPSTVAASGACAGTVHTVASGDSLWSIAASAVKSHDTARVNVAWHRIYSANHPPLANPSLLPVGTKLCIPTSV